MNVRSLLGRAAREPLLQFLVLGIALFAANALLHGKEQRQSGDAITITQGQVGQLIESYALLAGRAPSRGELMNLVDDYITEEIDYREGVAMGLDSDDTIVRRRMRQKMEFLVEDANASEAPTEAEMQAWLALHAADYRLPERRAIRQVLASGDKRGAKAPSDAQAFLTKLQSGADPAKVGDPSMLPAATPLTTEQGIEQLFGPDFAVAVFKREGKGWFGPIASPFGQHLVNVMEVEQGRSATLDDVRDRINSDMIESRRAKARDDFQARMRKRYSVTIDWPEPYNDLPKTPDPNPKVKKAPDEVAE
ncbi:MAG TPA: peptidyl-prolyl cis-trans isomerase [Hyphomonadaceae bacterium]|nr:peptidyl-prolyl cis-trans isomerase [Hyphomonadaceae bacterium]